MSRRGWYIVGGTVVVLLAMIAIGTNEEQALDPDGTGPSGARALVLLLESFAADVQVVDRTPNSDVDVAVLLDDRLSDSARRELVGWLRSGGTLVVADPSSPFVPQPNDIEIATFDPLAIRPGRCTVPALADVGDLEVDGRVGYPVVADARSCFGDDSSAFALVTDEGRGTLVAVGGAGVWTNESLDKADNAVLAVALLAPHVDVAVAVLRRQLEAPSRPSGSDDDLASPGERRDDVGGGTTDLFDLMPGYLRWVVLQLALAWFVYAVAEARRLGRPVLETQPVHIPGSEIVRATGRLLRIAPPSETAALLSESLRLELAQGLGLPTDSEPRTIAEVASRRCSLTAEEIEAVLVAFVVDDDAELVALSARVDHVRQEVSSVRTTRPD